MPRPRQAHILHVIRDVSGGGAFRALRTVAELTAALGGYHHRVLALGPAGPAGLRLAEAAGLEVLAPGSPHAARAVAEADLLHVHFWNTPELYAWLRQPLPPARLLLWVHVGGAHPPHALLPELFDFADLTLATGPFTTTLPVFAQAAARGRPARGLMAMADLSRVAGLAPRPHAGFNVGYIGTVDFIKLHPGFVAACAGIQVPEARFIVCGDGGAYGALKAEAARLGVSGRFDFRGYVDDIASVFAVLDVFGYPLCADNYSAAELVLQEAMAAGVPPVVLAHGGASAIVPHGVGGLVVGTLDDYQRAVEYLHREPAERQRLAQGAREYAWRHFGADRMARAMHDVYTALLAQPKRERVWPGGPVAGAAAFLQALGGLVPAFEASAFSHDEDEVLEAERAIAASSPVMASGASGGVLHYRAIYPQDALLRLWAGLILRAQGRPAVAAAEFKQAGALGLRHWRVDWYLAEAAHAAGAVELAAEAAARVLEAAPAFAPAAALAQRLKQRADRE